MPSAQSASSPASPQHSPGRRWLRWPLILPILVLVAAAFFHGLSLLHATPINRGIHLANQLPKSVQGWRVRSLALGETESVRNAVEKTLNYDDALYLEYAKNGVTVGVYVAYWGAGRMPTQLVYSHTPDRCWVENGWTCRETRYAEPVSMAGVALQSAEWRQFLPPGGGKPVYVRYWHLVAGKVYAHGARLNTIPHPLHWWRDVVKDAIRGRPEQYFIRLSANVPFETFWDDPGFAEVLRGLAGLGLAEPATGKTDR